MNEKLEEYVKKLHNKRIGIKKIKNRLHSQGYSNQDIGQSIKLIKEKDIFKKLFRYNFFVGFIAYLLFLFLVFIVTLYISMKIFNLS